MRLKLIITIPAIMVLLCSCQEKQRIITVDRDINDWVYSTIQENYLWASQLPDISATDRSLNPENYFNQYLRYRTTSRNESYSDDTYGDRFSYLEYKGSSTRSDLVAASETETGLGLGWQPFGTNENVIYCAITYVIPDSPAEKAGLKRGDIFNGINGNSLPVSLAKSINLMNQSSVTLDLIHPIRKSVTVQEATYQNNPILYHSILNTTPKIGYLVYNHFTPGTNSVYNNQLNEIFAGFKNEGVQNLILDFRYNPGGYVSTAIHLASLIAPADKLGQGFMYVESKDSYQNPDRFSLYSFEGADKVGSYNADIRNMIVLSSYKTASASELIIHGFNAFNEVNTALIGSTTHGKNQGTVTVTNSSYQWEINPVTSRIYDIHKVSGYEQGIQPDVNLQEYTPLAWGKDGLSSIAKYGEIGDTENEILLMRAIGYMLSGATMTDAGDQDVATDISPIHIPVPSNGLIFDNPVK